MTGTIVNTGAIIVGSAIRIVAGKLLPECLKTILTQSIGLSTLLIGMQMALSGRVVIPIIGCLLLGSLTGELLRIEDGLDRIGL